MNVQETLEKAREKRIMADKRVHESYKALYAAADQYGIPRVEADRLVQEACDRIQLKNVFPVTVEELTFVTSFDFVPGDQPILCLDHEALGGASKVIRWIKARGLDKRNRTGVARQLLISLLGRRGEDLSEMARYVDGITSKMGDCKRACRIAAFAIRNPNYVEPPNPDVDTRGGVSMAAFKETMRQAALPSNDPNKRD